MHIQLFFISSLNSLLDLLSFKTEEHINKNDKRQNVDFSLYPALVLSPDFFLLLLHYLGY